MKYEEYQKIVDDIVKAPDQAPTNAQSLLEAIKSDFELIDSQAVKIQELENKVRGLQDTNIKLYLAQTGSKNDEPKEEKPVTLDDLVKEIGGQ